MALSKIEGQRILISFSLLLRGQQRKNDHAFRQDTIIKLFAPCADSFHFLSSQRKRKNKIYLRVLRVPAVRNNKFQKPFLDKIDFL
jgi:hypothetical protein